MPGTLVLEARPDTTVLIHADEPPDGVSRPGLANAREELRHELANALTVAAGHAQWLLKRSPGADERERRALQAIRDSVTRALRLLDRPAELRPATTYDMQTLLTRAVDQIPSQRAQDARVRVMARTPLVVGADPDTVMQIVTNVLSNAAKYSQPGTPIEVELDRVADSARVSVRDHGIGIEPELLDAIFEGYRTSRARQMAIGQGIGLRLSRRLAEEAGGQLWATSAPGRGATFHLALPLARMDSLDGSARSLSSAGRRGCIVSRLGSEDAGRAVVRTACTTGESRTEGHGGELA